MRRALVRLTLRMIPAVLPLSLIVACDDLQGAANDDAATLVEGGIRGDQTIDAASGDANGPEAAVSDDAGLADAGDAAVVEASSTAADAADDAVADAGDDGAPDASATNDDAAADASDDASDDGAADALTSAAEAGGDSAVVGPVAGDASVDSSADSAAIADAGSSSTSTADASMDAGGPALPDGSNLVFSLNPALDVVGTVAKASALKSGTLLDTTGRPVATGVLVGKVLAFALGGVAPGDYFVEVNGDANDLVPTRIDDPTVSVSQQVGAGLRDALIGPPSSPTYRVRTWSRGQTSVGITSFAGTAEEGQPYLLLTYASGEMDFQVLGTGARLSSYTPPSAGATIHLTGDPVDSWVIESSGETHHSTCAPPGCHTGYSTKPATYGAVAPTNGWCFKCHLGTGGSGAGFVDVNGVAPAVPEDAGANSAADAATSPPDARVEASDAASAANEGGSAVDSGLDGWVADASGGGTTTVDASLDSAPETGAGPPPVTCPSTCAPGSSCVTVLATGQAEPRGIAVSGANVYWAAFYGNSIWKASTTCGGPVPIVSTANRPTSVAVDSTYVYYNNWDTGSLTGGVFRAPISGSSAPSSVAAPQEYPSNLTVDGENVYWLANSTSVLQVATPGGWPLTLTSNQHITAGLTSDGTNVYFAGMGASAADGFIGYVPVGVSSPVTPTQLVSAQYLPIAIARDALNLYWTTTDGNVLSMPKGGGAVVTLASGQGQLGSIASDGVNVYYVALGTPAGGAIVKVPVNASAVAVPIVLGQQTPDTVVVDATGVYWSDSSAGTISKFSPK